MEFHEQLYTSFTFLSFTRSLLQAAKYLLLALLSESHSQVQALKRSMFVIADWSYSSQSALPTDVRTPQQLQQLLLSLTTRAIAFHPSSVTRFTWCM